MANTAVARAQRCVQLIASQNHRINALISIVPAAEVLALAEKADRDGGAKNTIFLAVKDNFCTTDLPTTCSSRILEGFMSPYESTVTRLLREAGAIMVGKSNMDEFAMGSDSVTSAFGKTLNPRYEDSDVSPGGSSGGSAAAVAAGFADVALGSDTGGSVRLPAAYCGVYGFKPSYGLVSRHGLISYAQSLDTVGLLSKTLGNIRHTFDILSKFDKLDPTSLPESMRNHYIRRNAGFKDGDNQPRKLKIGVVKETIIDIAEPVRTAWTGALESLLSQGHTIDLVSAPAVLHALAAYYMIAPAEASSNLSRYDGIRYGGRSSEDREGQDGTLYAPTRSKLFGSEVQRRLILGTLNLSAAEYEKHFQQAQRVRHLLVKQFNKIFSSKNLLLGCGNETGSYDAIILPTARSLPPSLKELDNRDPVEHYVNDVLTVPASLAGIPAISIPWTKGIGIQVWAQHGDDEVVLALAQQLSPCQDLLK